MIGFLVLVILVGLFLLVRAVRKRGAKDAAAPEPGSMGEPPLEIDLRGLDEAGRLNASFARGLRRLRAAVSGREPRYQIPWLLLLGEEAAKTKLLATSGLDLVQGAPEEATESGCAWWLFDGGLVLDVAGRYVLTADGRGADDGAWRHLLRLLERNRPERPIDGVVLTIPCSELLAAPGQEEARRRAMAERKAAQLYARLWQAQKKLDLRFPVYVLVTGCERVPGFAGFVSAMPERVLHEIFGWSSPYSVDTAFQPEWVDEAFAEVRRDLQQAQLEVWGESARPREREAVFLLPDEVQALAEPLRAYLGQVFKQSAYHESMFLRGIYFCGADPEGLPPDTAVAATRPEASAADLAAAALLAPEAPRTLFVRDLFERKIFPERALARPTAGAFAAHSRAVLVAQVALAALVLLLGIGVWSAWVRLAERKTSLSQFLTETARDLREITQDSSDGTTDLDLLDRKALELFDGMADLDARRFGSVFLPSSWFSSFNRDLRLAVVRSYNGIICKALGGEFRRKARTLVEVSAAPPEPPAEVLPLDRTAEFAELRSFVTRLRELEKNFRIYEGLKTNQDLKELDAVVTYLLNRPLPRGFFENSDLYRSALRDVDYEFFTPEDVARLRRTASARTRALADSLSAVAFRDSPLPSRLDDLAGELAGLGQAGAADTAGLAHLLALLRETERMLAAPALPGLAATTPVFGAPYQQVLEDLRGSALLDSGLHDEVGAAVGQEQQRFRARLVEAEAPFVGRLLEVPADGRPQLAETVKVLEGGLEAFLNQSFAAAARERTFRTRPDPGYRLAWDAKLLQEAVALHEPYQLFVEKTLPRFAPELREPIGRVALDRLDASFEDVIARAQVWEPVGARGLEEQVVAEVDGMKLAGPPLAQLLDLLDRLALAETHRRLSELVAAQNFAALRLATRLLEQEDLYVPAHGGFSWWTGAKGPAVQAFGLADPTEVPAYLEAQRDRIAYLAREYADPLIKALPRRLPRREPEEVAVLATWKGILTELQKYDGKKPGNSVAALETFVGTEMQALDVAGCSRALPARALSEAAGDWFLKARSRLRRDLYARCRVLAGDEATVAYERIESAFNQRLAGRFPFADAAPGGGLAEADPEAVREFFELYDRYQPLLAAVPEEGDPLGPASPAARRFLARLARVRAFLAPFLDGEDRPRVPVYDVDVDFRVNRESEAEGNQIIRWELTCGGKTVTQRDGERRVRWALGTPLRLALQWAKDSPVVPLGGDGQPIADREIVFEQANRWSLPAFLAERAASAEDFQGFSDPQPHTLRLLVDTQNAESGTKGRARVFVRLKLRSVDGKQEVRLPDFPARAPRLGEVRTDARDDDAGHSEARGTGGIGARGGRAEGDPDAP